MRLYALVLLCAATAMAGDVVTVDQYNTLTVRPESKAEIRERLARASGVAPTDRATAPAHATLYAREWQLIALLYRYSTPETAGVDPTGDAAANYDKLVTYAAGIADISTRMGVMADADRMQFLWAWCERERSKLGVTVGYGERYISS
jgi:hypothetical protein